MTHGLILRTKPNLSLLHPPKNIGYHFLSPARQSRGISVAFGVRLHFVSGADLGNLWMNFFNFAHTSFRGVHVDAFWGLGKFTY